MTLSVKCGQFTGRATTGSQAVTGVGFQPKFLMLWSNGQSSNGTTGNLYVYSHGFSDGTTNCCRTWLSVEDFGVGLGIGILFNTNILRLLTAAGAAYEVTLTSFDSDGFTINVPANSWGSQPLINYVAIAGTDITNVKVLQFDTGTTSTGNKAYTGVGFQPDFGMFSSIDGTAYNTLVNGGSSSFGAAVSSTQRAAHIGLDEYAQSPSDTWRYQLTDKCLVTLNVTGGLDAEADFVSWGTDGFTLNWTNAPGATTDKCIGVFIKGGRWEIGNFTQKTSTGTQTTTLTDSALDPELLILNSMCNTATSSIVAHNRQALGAGTASDEVCTWGGSTDAITGNSQLAEITSVTKAIVLATETATSATVNAEADISDLGTVGEFTLDWTTADATARQLWYIALGIEGEPAGGELFERTAAGSVTISASPVRMKKAYRSVSGSVTMNAPVVRMLTAFRTLEESHTIEAAVQRLRTVSKTVDETVESAADVIRMLFANRTLSESLTIDGTVERFRTVLRTIEETLEIDAVVARMLSAFRTLEESLTLEAVVARMRTVLRSLDETVELEAVVARLRSIARTLEETLELEAVVAVLRSISRSLSESLDIDAQVAKISYFFRTLDETVELEAVVVRLRTILRTLEETLELEAVVTRMLSAFRTLEESFTITDDVHGAKIFFREVVEELTVVGDVVRQLFSYRTLSESLTIDAQVARIKTFLRTVDETLEIEAVVARIRSVPKTLSETVELDAIVARMIFFNRSLSETVELVAEVVRARFIDRVVEETLELVDEVARVRTIPRTLSENLEIDAVVARMLAATRTISETLEIDGQVTRTKTFFRDLVENLEIDAQVVRMRRVLKSVSESFTIVAEAVQESGVTILRSVNESFTIQTQLSLFVCWVGGRGPLPIIIKKVGRFFSILPQRNIRPYTIKSRFIKFSENQEVEP